MAAMTPLEKPVVLKQPAFTATVVASGALERIPAAVADAVGQVGASKSPFRPVPGQKLVAWQIDITESRDMTPQNVEDGGWMNPINGARDASATVKVEVDGQPVPIHSSFLDFTSFEGRLLLSCSRVPCLKAKHYVGSYLMVISAEKVDGAELVVATAGQVERVPLNGGVVKTEHSTVLYELETSSVDVGVAVPRQTVEALQPGDVGREDSSSVTVTYGFTVSKAYLTSFDMVKGWAPAGRAWLVLDLDDAECTLPEGYSMPCGMEISKAWVASSGGAEYQALDIDDVGSVVTFDVPADARQFHVTANPEYAIGYRYWGQGGDEYRVKKLPASEPISFDLTFS